ncbi:helix-turn-helix domain-containing protein [Staphylococcus haemolyticus]|uniref:helix-turn-helix domain-containing protein n=1 Tax=Staphylococcus haemolyticus TaxID=1283 RepID=UPI000A11B3A7|nr:helix-turn-helix transcriptional regulator [Staphylococcus haemolyticus]
MTLVRKIKERRLKKGQTQTEYGKEFGAGKSLVCQWEKGINKPNCKRLKMIADDMNITVTELLKS